MSEDYPAMEGPVCPLPHIETDRVVMGHGSGGRMMADLIRSVFRPPLSNPVLEAENDAGVVQPTPPQSLAISTDAHVVSPLFFRGGDIGKLAICGTVNDVAMVGADPKYLTASFILEEGLAISTLQKVVASMQSAAEEAGVQVVAGDTKVVSHGEADGLYISTTGIGIPRTKNAIGGDQARPGDVVILSGTMGDHGIAVLEARGELGFETKLESDIAPLNHLVTAMLEASPGIHVLRDPTRGGVATALNEIARQSNVGVLIRESSLPLQPAVQAACEMLGFDPLYIANEGKLLAVVKGEDAEKVLMAMRNTRYGEEAAIIGEITDQPRGRLLMETPLGSKRVVDTLSGEMLPRIC